MSAFTYYGGKAMYAKDIAEVIERQCEGKRVDKYVEPFCGWCSVMARLISNGKLQAKQFVASDYNKSLVMMWKGLSRGTWKVPTRAITKKEWLQLKDAPPSALKAFAGVVYSFNGRYFSWYRVPLRPDSQRLHQRGDILAPVRFAHKKYDDKDYLAMRGCVFYLDPPYQARAFEYKHDTGKAGDIKTPTFDHARFWEVARQLAKNNVVIVSEYAAPRDWKCVAVIGKRGHKEFANVNCVSPNPEKLFMWAPRPAAGAGAAAAAADSRKTAPATTTTTTPCGLRSNAARSAPPPPPPRPAAAARSQATYRRSTSGKLSAMAAR